MYVITLINPKKKMHHHHKLILFLVFWVLLISHEFCAAATDEENEEQKMKKRDKTVPYSSATQILQNSYTAFRRSAKTQWEIFKYLINQLEMHFAPPNLDFRTGNVPGSGETIKAAAEKSFHVSKEAAEATAKSAGKAMGEAAQKMKESATNQHHSQDEL